MQCWWGNPHCAKNRRGLISCSNYSKVSSSAVQTGGGWNLMRVIWEDSLTTHVVTSCG
jgi:hypothetical protein